MDFEVIINTTYWFVTVLEKLSIFDLLQLEQVSFLFRDAVNQDIIWRGVAKCLFQGKEFIPAICSRLLVLGNTKEVRKDLEQLTVRQLKQFCTGYRIDTSNCCEKME